MNYSILTVLNNTCLKIDKNLKQKLFNKWCKSYVSDDRIRLGYISSGSRCFHSSYTLSEAQKDGVEVLLSPQEVSVFVYYDKKYSKKYILCIFPFLYFK